MISLTIIDGPFVVPDEDGQPLSQGVLVSIGNGLTSYSLPVGGIPLDEDVPAWLQAQVQSLWETAERLGHPDDVLFSARERELLIAFARVVLDEINLLRQAIVTIHPAAEGQLPQRTMSQVRQAIIKKLK